MITIGGLPAELFLQRAIRVRNSGAAKHMMPCVLKAVKDRKLVIRPSGHKHDEEIDPESAHPWWAKNPDLKKMLTNHSTKSEAPVVPIAALVQSGNEPTKVEPVVAPEPAAQEATVVAPAQETPVPEDTPWQPNDDNSVLIVPVSAPISWLSLYERYVRTKQDAAEAMSMYLAMEAEAKSLEEQLATIGVQIQMRKQAIEPRKHDKHKPSGRTTSERQYVQEQLNAWVRTTAILGRTYSCAEITNAAGVRRHEFKSLKNKLDKAAKRSGRIVKMTVTLAGKKRMASFEFAHK